MSTTDHLYLQDIHRHLTVCKAKIVSSAEMLTGEEEKAVAADLILAVGLLQMQAEARVSDQKGREAGPKDGTPDERDGEAGTPK